MSTVLFIFVDCYGCHFPPDSQGYIRSTQILETKKRHFLQNASPDFDETFRECSFKLVGSESGEKSKRAKIFAYISQLFVYKTRLWTQLRTRSRYSNVRAVYAFVLISRSFQTVGFFFQASYLFTKRHECKQKNHKAFSYPIYLHYQEAWGAENFFGNRKLQKT